MQEIIPPARQIYGVVINPHNKQRVLLELDKNYPMWQLPYVTLDQEQNPRNALTAMFYDDMRLTVKIAEEPLFIIPAHPTDDQKIETHFYKCMAQCDLAQWHKKPGEKTDDQSQVLVRAWHSSSMRSLPNNMQSKFHSAIQKVFHTNNSTPIKHGHSCMEILEDLDASEIYELDTWLKYSQTQKRIKENKLDFDLEKIEGIGPYLDLYLDKEILKLYKKNHPSMSFERKNVFGDTWEKRAYSLKIPRQKNILLSKDLSSNAPQ